MLRQLTWCPVLPWTDRTTKPRYSKEKWLMRIAWNYRSGHVFLVGRCESEVATGTAVTVHLFCVVR
jgi:hypothetical protein